MYVRDFFNRRTKEFAIDFDTSELAQRLRALGLGVRETILQ